MVGGQLNKRKNGLFTIAEIQDIWASRSWSGKKGGNPMIVRGGYNCRHQFSYVNPDWYEDDGEESQILKTREPIVKKQKNVNISSLANPITLTAIRPVSIKESKLRIQKQIDQNKLDSRYARNPDGTIKTRFNGESRNAEKVNIRGVSEQTATLITALFDELNELAIKYNVPKLRGLDVRPSKRYAGRMGGGVLYVGSDNAERLTALGKSKTNKWKYGQDVSKRPFSVKDYYDNPVDKLRSTFYHEFGHHIHQMKYVTPAFKDKLGRVYGDRGFTPEIEERLSKIVRSEKRKSKTGLIGNSEYGDVNPQEWFAEQFSAYTFGLMDKVHPEFKKLIKEIEDEVGR
jgi:hypothetical protein